MILFAGVNRQYSSQLDIQNRLIDNAKSGIAYGLANFHELDNKGTVDLDLFGKGIDSVAIESGNWGAFQLIRSKSHHKQLTYKKLALAGSGDNKNLENLFLADLGRPFSICGKTRLEGSISIPKAGVKRAYIEGQNYQGNELIYGQSSVSGRSLPEVNQEFLEGLMEITATVQQWEAVDSIYNSFGDEAVHFVDDYIITLEHNVVLGHVIIEARDSIFVGKDARIEDAILKSKVIHIENGFVGNLQCYASERITLEENVTLIYPSVLGLIEEGLAEEVNAQISIAKGSQVIGSVFALSKAPNFRYPVQVSVENEARIDGLLYCAGRTELQGIVNGNLYTQKFYLETSSSKYENHVLNGQVLNRLPDNFVVIPLLEDNSVLTQIDCLK